MAELRWRIWSPGVPVLLLLEPIVLIVSLYPSTRREEYEERPMKWGQKRGRGVWQYPYPTLTPTLPSKNGL